MQDRLYGRSDGGKPYWMYYIRDGCYSKGGDALQDAMIFFNEASALDQIEILKLTREYYFKRGEIMNWGPYKIQKIIISGDDGLRKEVAERI